MPASLPTSNLSEFFRFALLLTGSPGAAEQALALAFDDVSANLDQLRNEEQRHAWLAVRLREQCLSSESPPSGKPPRLLRGQEAGEQSEVLELEAYILAQHFRLLPEPGRTALALFYLDLFTAGRIADILKMRLEDLANAIGAARRKLQESLLTAEQPKPLQA